MGCMCDSQKAKGQIRPLPEIYLSREQLLEVDRDLIAEIMCHDAYSRTAMMLRVCRRIIRQAIMMLDAPEALDKPMQVITTQQPHRKVWPTKEEEPTE